MCLGSGKLGCVSTGVPRLAVGNVPNVVYSHTPVIAIISIYSMTSEELTHSLLGNNSVKQYLSLKPPERYRIRAYAIVMVNPIFVLGVTGSGASLQQPNEFLAQLSRLRATDPVRTGKPDVNLEELIAEYRQVYFEDNHFVMSLSSLEQIPRDEYQTGMGIGDVASLIRFITIGVDISDMTEAIPEQLMGIYRFSNAKCIVIELYGTKTAYDTSTARIQALLASR